MNGQGCQRGRRGLILQASAPSFCVLGALGSGRAAAVPPHTQNRIRNGLNEGVGRVDRGEMCGGAFQNQKYTILSQGWTKKCVFFCGFGGVCLLKRGRKTAKMASWRPFISMD